MQAHSNMLRKIAHIILSLFLLLANTGVDFSVHYCGGKLINVALNPEHKSCCSEGEDNCCEIKTEKIQFDETYLIPQSDHLFKNISRDLQCENQKLFNETLGFAFFDHQQLNNNHKSPPPPLIQETLARLQTYRL